MNQYTIVFFSFGIGNQCDWVSKAFERWRFHRLLGNMIYKIVYTSSVLLADALRLLACGLFFAEVLRHLNAKMRHNDAAGFIRVRDPNYSRGIGAFKRCSMPDNVNVTLAPAHQGGIQRELSLLNFFKGAFEGGTGLETGISESESCERSIIDISGLPVPFM
ncbi:hypothetical protein C8R42DRAFT_647386 [Lentinula raphanica]|nr:hypothetical protein C8R42DRAFT_647386 [Lentinula raphanica]